MPTYSTKDLSSYAAIKRNRLHPLFKMYYSIKKRPTSSAHTKKLLRKKKLIEENQTSSAFDMEKIYEKKETNKKNSIFQFKID